MNKQETLHNEEYVFYKEQLEIAKENGSNGIAVGIEFLDYIMNNFNMSEN